MIHRMSTPSCFMPRLIVTQITQVDQHVGHAQKALADLLESYEPRQVEPRQQRDVLARVTPYGC